jgi:hypothetical protein
LSTWQRSNRGQCPQIRLLSGYRNNCKPQT